MTIREGTDVLSGTTPGHLLGAFQKPCPPEKPGGAAGEAGVEGRRLAEAGRWHHRAPRGGRCLPGGGLGDHPGLAQPTNQPAAPRARQVGLHLRLGQAGRAALQGRTGEVSPGGRRELALSAAPLSTPMGSAEASHRSLRSPGQQEESRGWRQQTEAASGGREGLRRAQASALRQSRVATQRHPVAHAAALTGHQPRARPCARDGDPKDSDPGPPELPLGLRVDKYRTSDKRHAGPR